MVRYNNVKPKFLGLVDTITETLKCFEENFKAEPINDWQGNEDFNKFTMDVIRDITLKFSPGYYANDLNQLAIACGADIPWADDHFQERISGTPTNPGDTYKKWPYHSNLDQSNYKDEKFSHTYQERFWPKKAGKDHIPPNFIINPNHGIRYQYGDLNDLISQLEEKLLTRQAYLPIWFPEDTGAKGRRVPCTLGYYFYIKPEDLSIHLIYTIRSCDLYRHFRNDIYLTTRLLIHIYDILKTSHPNLQLGTVKMDIYNLHRFSNDKYMFDKKEKKIKLWQNNLIE